VSGAPDISVVIPFYNEAARAMTVIDEVIGVLSGIGRPFELVLIDDGSSDGTSGVLLEAAARWPVCRVWQHTANAGQGAALLHGLRVSTGDILVTLDGDGQNDPADLPRMIDLLEGADMVSGVRTPRHDPWVRRIMSVVANTVRRRWLRDGAHDAGCALRVFRRSVLDSLLPIRTLYSFMPACAAAAGHRTVECAVRHRPRLSGSSKYGLRSMLWRPLLDMLAIGWLQRRRIPDVEVRPLGADPKAPGR
jgi:glycosyltransferase involved in cell wall biosynthesis